MPPLGLYVHVPFCAMRCSYCDFNTYTGGDRASWAPHAIAELRLARAALGEAARPVDTVFVGGGTPTLLDPAEIGAVLRAIGDELGLAAAAEVTVEANPDSVDPASLAALRGHGVTRISIGMQSAVPHVLRFLGRTHAAGRPAAAAGEARAAGFDHVSLDLIYGTPGESDADWRHSLEQALAAEPDHLSAYALSVQPGTRLAAQVRRGALPHPDGDVQARRYELADARLAAAGLGWYELSNWAAGEAARCRHNLGYWRSEDWWGAGPGAHSHVGGERWWNVLHPDAWARRVERGESPAAGREALTDAERRTERIMLGIRLAEGLGLQDRERAAAAAWPARGSWSPRRSSAATPSSRSPGGCAPTR